jgi:hypothetical protein
MPRHHGDHRHSEEASARGKDLHEFSQETVQMFRRDAVKSGYSLLPTLQSRAVRAV